MILAFLCLHTTFLQFKFVLLACVCVQHVCTVHMPMHTCVHACSWLPNAGDQYHSSVSFRLLNSLSWTETLKTTVAARLTEMLHVEPVEAVLLSDAPAQSLLFSLTSYLEALMENFPLGAECLQEKLVEGRVASWSCATQHFYQLVAP